MSLNAKKVAMTGGNTGPKQEAIEGGTYPCRLVQVLDLGLQAQRPYKGEEKPPKHEIMLTYEFVDEFCLDDDGKEIEDKPRWLSETMPLNNLEVELAKSTKRYNALDPECIHEGDFTELVGVCCMVTVANKAGTGTHAGKTFTNITGVSTMRPKEAAKAPELANPSKVFVLDEPDLEVLNSLPDWLQDKIKGNLEFAGSVLDKALNGGEAQEKAPEDEKEEDNKDDEGEW